VAEPPAPRPLASATSLNPKAGQHAVTADPRELAAAERAGERSWAAWSYYARRYGERGRQFTRSDSGWLATLPGSPTSLVVRQVQWLGTVLASRGMPRLLLEEHLRALHEELVAAVPERSAEYAALLQAADALRDERLAHMPESVLRRLEHSFSDLLEPGLEDDVRAGILIAAAVVDERAGIPQATSSLLEWLADPARFPERWLTAVDQTLRLARATVTDRPGHGGPSRRARPRRRAWTGRRTLPGAWLSRLGDRRP
jgi:hypothetical protein